MVCCDADEEANPLSRLAEDHGQTTMVCQGTCLLNLSYINNLSRHTVQSCWVPLMSSRDGPHHLCQCQTAHPHPLL